VASLPVVVLESAYGKTKKSLHACLFVLVGQFFFNSIIYVKVLNKILNMKVMKIVDN
jgi:hypothetical protein